MIILFNFLSWIIAGEKIWAAEGEPVLVSCKLSGLMIRIEEEEQVLFVKEELHDVIILVYEVSTTVTLDFITFIHGLNIRVGVLTRLLTKVLMTVQFE